MTLKTAPPGTGMNLEAVKDLMTPTTAAKAGAIRNAIAFAPEYRSTQIADLAIVLAMLTSASKDEREKAKQNVRELVRAGALIIATERAAADLAERANHFEP